MKKKNFYFVITRSTRHIYGGLVQTAKIYTINKGQLVYCCDANWKTASYCGKESEVFQALIDKGCIPAKYEKLTGGYFRGVACDKYNIQEV